MKGNELAIIIAFYLSKYDKLGIKNLGFENNSEAFTKIGEILGVKKNYVKFRRDEFDAIHPWRRGWRRPMDVRILNTIEALQDLSEIELREIVQSILKSEDFRSSNEVYKIISLIDENNRTERISSYILRVPTGKKAEQYFIEYFKRNGLPISGELIDTRDFGVGYDFKIKSDEIEYFIEIKGLTEVAGGILFTSKEWEVAKLKGKFYFLVIISDINNEPIIKLIQDPYNKLNPMKNINRIIQISYSVSKINIENVVS